MTTDVRGSFLTHQAYIEAIRHAIEILADAPPGASAIEWDPTAPKMNFTLAEGLAARVRSSNGYESLSTRTIPDTRRFIANLRNAWTTEALMYVTGKHLPAEGLGTATNWTVVQAYYAVYLVAKATAIAQGKTGPLNSHPLIQRFFIDFWAEGSRRDLAPWSVVWGIDGPRNLPTSVALEHPQHIWTTARREACWARLTKAWETTRAGWLEDALREAREKKAKDRRRAWAQENDARVANHKQPRRRPPRASATLRPEEKATVDRSVPAAGFLNYLYRLRIRSNYEDSAMWSEGPIGVEESLGVHWNLTTITSATLLAHEVLLRRIVGNDDFDGIADDWLQKNQGLLGPLEGLGLRAQVLRGHR